MSHFRNSLVIRIEEYRLLILWSSVFVNRQYFDKSKIFITDHKFLLISLTIISSLFNFANFHAFELNHSKLLALPPIIYKWK